LILWAGSLWSTVWVALTIFHAQPDRHLSGILAARLFTIETYLGLAVALFALARGNAPRVHAARVATARFRFGFLAVALLLVNEWVLKLVMDRALARGSALGMGFGPWHGISALIYMAACAAVVAVVCEYDL
jgi:Domain of unknown function (DUF4149)